VPFRRSRDLPWIAQDDGSGEAVIRRDAQLLEGGRVFDVRPQTYPAGPEAAAGGGKHEISGRQGSVVIAGGKVPGNTDKDEARGIVEYVEVLVTQYIEVIGQWGGGVSFDFFEERFFAFSGEAPNPIPVSDDYEFAGLPVSRRGGKAGIGEDFVDEGKGHFLG